MKTLHDASQVLMKHVVFALGHSMDLKKDGIEPMMPFAVVISGDQQTLKVFGGDTLDYADKRFEATIIEEKPDFVVYASDTYLTVDGVKYDAVLFKAYDKNDTAIYLIGQKYRPKTDQVEFAQIGNPGFLGTETNKYFNSNNSSLKEGSQKRWWKFW